jgi:glutathione synthase/RimK-type ligase-like ATP-grasp enzyme
LIPELELKSDSSQNDLFNFIKQNPSEFYILKPKSGQQAIGIEKVDRNELLKNVEVYLSAKYTGKYLLQNFVESSTMYRCFAYSVNGLSRSNSAYIRVPKDQNTKLMDGTKRTSKALFQRVKLFAKEVCQTLTEHCGLKESFIAVDFLEDPKGRIWLLKLILTRLYSRI